VISYLEGALLKKFVLYFILILSLIPSQILAIDCSDLTSDSKIVALTNKAKEAYPLERSTISGQFVVSPCEKKGCLKKNRKERKKNAMLMHSVRSKGVDRTYFITGENAPVCVVRKENRKYKCSECGANFNDQCRSFNSESSIEGTNLDTIDMKILGSSDYKNSCRPHPKSKKHFIITSKKIGGDSLYNKVISYYEKKRGLLIRVNYYADKTLRKVYLFSEKGYIPFGDDWLASYIKVRSTQGSLKKYSFETKITISKQKKKLMVFPAPEQDPYLEQTPVEVLFSTN